MARLTCRAPRANFSINEPGSTSTLTSIRVNRGASSWNVTTPWWLSPWTTCHLIRSSGRCSSISAWNSLETPQIFDLNAMCVLVLLAHAGDPVHELGPLLELRELVVDGRDRHADVDRLLDGHAPTLADAVGFVLPAAIALVVAVLAAAQAGDQALARLLGDAARTAGVLDLVVHDVRRRALDLLARLLHGL